MKRTMKNKEELALVKADFMIMEFLSMRFGDGSGQDLQVNLVHKEIMGIVKKLLEKERVNSYTKGHNKGYLEGINEIKKAPEKLLKQRERMAMEKMARALRMKEEKSHENHYYKFAKLLDGGENMKIFYNGFNSAVKEQNQKIDKYLKKK